MVRILWVETLATGIPRLCQRVLSLSHAFRCVVMVVMALVVPLAVVMAPVARLMVVTVQMVHQEAEERIPPEAVRVRMVPSLSISQFRGMTGWRG